MRDGCRNLARFAILGLLLVGCHERSTAPDTDFSLRVAVVDSNGSPVPDLQVVAWNLSSELEAYLQDAVFKRKAVTTIRFAVPDTVVCDLQITDLEGRVLDRPFEDLLCQPGSYSVAVGPNLEFKAGVQVFGYELVARDPHTESELFRDHRWMTAVHVDPGRLVDARTDSRGIWSTTDRSFSPGLYDLGELTATDETGQVVGTFSLDDTFKLRLYDGVGTRIGVDTTVSDGPNRIDVVWRPIPFTPPAPQAQPDVERLRAGLLRTAGPVAEFRLYQNSPNPFN
jgi:hypothetical protein